MPEPTPGTPLSTWGIKMRFFGTITGHAPLDNPDDKYIMDSDETLIVLMWENCSKRFPYVAKCKKNEVKYDPTNPNYQTRWSNSSAGQNKFGGWNDDGRARFVELCRAIKTAKRKEHVLDLEESHFEGNPGQVLQSPGRGRRRRGQRGQ